MVGVGFRRELAVAAAQEELTSEGGGSLPAVQPGTLVAVKLKSTNEATTLPLRS
jgi:hypothetical protein